MATSQGIVTLPVLLVCPLLPSSSAREPHPAPAWTLDMPEHREAGPPYPQRHTQPASLSMSISWLQNSTEGSFLCLHVWLALPGSGSAGSPGGSRPGQEGNGPCHLFSSSLGPAPRVSAKITGGAMGFTLNVGLSVPAPPPAAEQLLTSQAVVKKGFPLFSHGSQPWLQRRW